MEHVHSEDLVIACVHVVNADAFPAVFEEGPEPSVFCAECAQIDWGSVDWSKVENYISEAKKSIKLPREMRKWLMNQRN